MGLYSAALSATGDHVCARASSFSSESSRLLGRHGVDSGRMSTRMKRLVARIRSEVTRDGEEDPKYHHLFRQPLPGVAWTTITTTTTIHEHLLAWSIDKSACKKTDPWGMDEATASINEEMVEVEASKLESSEYSIVCYEVEPGTVACQFLHLASRISDEVDWAFQLRKSKKPQRLSTTSWDLLD